MAPIALLDLLPDELFAHVVLQLLSPACGCDVVSAQQLSWTCKYLHEQSQPLRAKAKEEQGRANTSTVRDQECRLWRNGDRHNSSHNGARRIGTHGTSSNGLSHNNNNNKGVSSKRQQVRRNLG